jgi:hypothetical protein
VTNQSKLSSFYKPDYDKITNHGGLAVYSGIKNIQDEKQAFIKMLRKQFQSIISAKIIDNSFSNEISSKIRENISSIQSYNSNKKTN